jgi:hypothetical protein
MRREKSQTNSTQTQTSSTRRARALVVLVLTRSTGSQGAAIVTHDTVPRLATLTDKVFARNHTGSSVLARVGVARVVTRRVAEICWNGR